MMPKKDDNNLLQSLPKIAIVYLLYYHEPGYIDRMVAAFQKVCYPKDRMALIIVSNPHDEKGSFLPYIEKTVLPLSGVDIPEVIVLPQEKNKGFAEGNNVGADWAIEHGYDYVFFHNNDGFVAPDSFEPMMEYMESHPNTAMAQMLMLLYPETDQINSAGNSFHYLGFGFSNEYKTDISKVSLPEASDISYASGGALMVRSEMIKEFGAWDPLFFLYHEDLEWSVRLRIAGYDIVLMRDAIFYHQYEFSRSVSKFYWMERNRFGVLLMFYKWPTLLFLLPMLFIMEIGQIIFAIKNGWFAERKKVYQYWMQKKNWQPWLERRKKMQESRVRTDRYLLSYTVPTIQFQEPGMMHPLLKYVANPLMYLYYQLLRCIIHW